jgi:hypothetical protein
LKLTPFYNAVSFYHTFLKVQLPERVKRAGDLMQQGIQFPDLTWIWLSLPVGKIVSALSCVNEAIGKNSGFEKLYAGLGHLEKREIGKAGGILNE